MNKGFYSLNKSCARETTYWNAEAPSCHWEALDWKAELDTSFARTVTTARRPSVKRSESNDQEIQGFSLFRDDDVKRSQNCAILGRRVVSKIAFNKSMSASEVLDDLMDSLREWRDTAPESIQPTKEAWDSPKILLELFVTAFETNGSHDTHVDAIFQHLKLQSEDQVRENMKTHEYLLYQLRIEHETRNIKMQLTCMKNAYSILCSEAPLHLQESKRILAAVERTRHPWVRSIVGAMREMAAYYMHGNNSQMVGSYIPDIIKFAASVKEKNDTFSCIFLKYYRVEQSDSEFESFISDCCRVFGEGGNVDWSQRQLARTAFGEHLRHAEQACSVFSKDSDMWQSFEVAELQTMRSIVRDVNDMDTEAYCLMWEVAKSLGIQEDQKGELLVVFDTIFQSLSKSLKLVAERRKELQIERYAILQAEQMRREEEDSRLIAVEADEQRDTWSSICDSLRFEILGSFIRAFLCSTWTDKI